MYSAAWWALFTVLQAKCSLPAENGSACLMAPFYLLLRTKSPFRPFVSPHRPVKFHWNCMCTVLCLIWSMRRPLKRSAAACGDSYSDAPQVVGFRHGGSI